MYLLSYLMATLYLFNFGPIKWAGRTWEVNSFLLVTWLFLILGYFIATRMKISNKSRKPIQLDIRKIIKYGMLFNIITMPFAIYAYTGKLPTQISLDLSMQGEMHEQFYEHVIQSKGSTFRTILSFVRAIFAPFIYGSIILGFKYWKNLDKRYRILVIISVLVQVFFSFSRGTDKEIADLIIFFIAAAIVNRDRNILKKFGKYLIFALIFVTFVSVFTERRAGRYNFDMPNCFSQANICVDPENSAVSSVIGRNNYIGLSMFVNYLTQGYNGLSLAMDLDYESTYGLGHAPIVSRIYERISGDFDLYYNTYNYRLRTKGWSDLYSWSTLYTWIANDVSFYLVPLVIFLLGGILGLSWRQTVLYNNDIAYMVFSLMFLSLIYSPANNQLGISLEMFTTWIFWLTYWAIKNNQKRKSI